MIDVNFETPALTLADGERVADDLLLAVDGLWFFIRSRFFDQNGTQSQSIGHMVYRILIPIDQIIDSDLKS